MAGHEVSRIDEIGALYGLFAEAQMAHGEAAGLLGVVGKVTLSIHVGMVAYYLYGVLVRANGAVGTKAIELAGDGAFGSGVDLLGHRQGQIGHVVNYAYGEAGLGVVLLQLVINGLDH